MPKHLKPPITFLYYCGVRLGEARQIEWQQVDLEGGLIRLEAEQTKNSAARTVSMPDALIEMLEHKNECKVFDSTSLRKGWAKACVAAKIGVREPKDKAGNQKYVGLIIRDFRRSAIKI